MMYYLILDGVIPQTNTPLDSQSDYSSFLFRVTLLFVKVTIQTKHSLNVTSDWIGYSRGCSSIRGFVWNSFFCISVFFLRNKIGSYKIPTWLLRSYYVLNRS
jgi:hypothetical protein